MALDLSTKPVPWTDTNAINTTLTAISPPNGAAKLTLKTSVASYIQIGTGADGDAVTSGKAYPLAANTDYEICLEADEHLQRPQPTLLVASQSGEGTVYLLAEGS